MDLDWWSQFLSNQGLAITIVALLMAAAVRYAPRVIQAHLAFVQAATEQGERIVQISETQLTRYDDLADHHTKHRSDLQRTHHALTKACDVIDCFARGSPHEAEIKAHVAGIRHTLDSDR